MTSLIIEFAGEYHQISPTRRRVTFGRIADLEIDTNQYLHRTVGAFEWIDDAWWLVNTGSAIVLELSDVNSASRISIAPGSSIHVSFSAACLRFQAGRSRYEINLEQTIAEPPTVVLDDMTGDATVTASSAPLNQEQRYLLTGLARRRLMDSSAPKSALATNREVTESLGWTKSKFDRKLDNLCSKFANLGVHGLIAVPGSAASKRREDLVDYVLVVGLITDQDLADLDEEIKRVSAVVEQ